MTGDVRSLLIKHARKGWGIFCIDPNFAMDRRKSNLSAVCLKENERRSTLKDGSCVDQCCSPFLTVSPPFHWRKKNSQLQDFPLPLSSW